MVEYIVNPQGRADYYGPGISEDTEVTYSYGNIFFYIGIKKDIILPIKQEEIFMKRTFTRSDWKSFIQGKSSKDITDFLDDQYSKLYTIRKIIDDEYDKGNTNAYFQLRNILRDMIQKDILVFIINAISFSYDTSIQTAAITLLNLIFEQTDAVVYELYGNSKLSTQDINEYRALMALRAIDWINLFDQYEVLTDRIADMNFICFAPEQAKINRILDEDAKNTGCDKAIMMALYQNIDLFVHHSRSITADAFNKVCASNFQILECAMTMNKGSIDSIDIEDTGIHEAFILWLECQYDVCKFMSLRNDGLAKKYMKK